MILLQITEDLSFTRLQETQSIVDRGTTLGFSNAKSSSLKMLNYYSSTKNPTIVSVREIDSTKFLIQNYLKGYFEEHDEVYPSDIADALELRYDLVREAFDILEKEGKIRKKGE